MASTVGLGVKNQLQQNPSSKTTAKTKQNRSEKIGGV